MHVECFKNTGKLDLVTSRPDLRRDLHLFVEYVSEHDIKRTHRDNALPKGDTVKLAKLLSDLGAADDIAEQGRSRWVDFVDRIAHALGFVKYDTKGVYMGYSSQAPSYPDNFIEFKAREYDAFLRKSLSQQESQLLNVLSSKDQGSNSEFFSTSVLGRLDPFSTFGSATGVVPSLDFQKSRRFLLELLAQLPTGEWLSTASLIAMLKQCHRYFLIPEKPRFANKWDQQKGRYGNFREDEAYYAGTAINESDPDAFERAEGRYVERFLEGIPHLLGYVDVGYGDGVPKARPSFGALPAFRVSQRLRRALTGSIAEPTVRVTPTFEVYVQSEVHPARVLSQVSRIAECISADATTVFQLTKQKVAAAQAADSKLNVIGLLESLSSTPLPENVRRELTDWSEHGERFVLYDGFALLETEPEVTVPEKFRVERIDGGTYIVHSPDALFEELECQERMPLAIRHPEKTFAPLPDNVRSSLRGKKRKKSNANATKPQITLLRVSRVQLLCPDREFLQRLHGVLASANCPVEADVKGLSLSYASRYETEVGKAIRGLRSEFRVKIEDKG